MIPLLVIIARAVCFFLGGVILTTHHLFFSSRRLIDWLIFVLPTQFLLTLAALLPQKKYHLPAGIWFVTSAIIICSLFIDQLSLRTLLLPLIRCITNLLILMKYQRRIFTRRTQNNLAYLTNNLGFRIGSISLLTSISLISTLAQTGISCTQIEQSLRVSGIQAKISEYTLGSVLGTPSTATGLAQFSGVAQSLSGVTQPGILGLLTKLNAQFYTLVIEQQNFLNHNICELIITQLTNIQNRPGRQIGSIVLLYIILRPLLSLIVHISVLIRRVVRHILLGTHLIKKQTKRTKRDLFTIQ